MKRQGKARSFLHRLEDLKQLSPLNKNGIEVMMWTQRGKAWPSIGLSICPVGMASHS